MHRRSKPSGLVTSLNSRSKENIDVQCQHLAAERNGRPLQLCVCKWAMWIAIAQETFQKVLALASALLFERDENLLNQENQNYNPEIIDQFKCDTFSYYWLLFPNSNLEIWYWIIYIKRGMQVKGIWKQDPEASIWAQEAPHEEHHSLYRSPNIFRVIKSRRLRWACHIARIEEVKSAFKILT